MTYSRCLPCHDGIAYPIKNARRPFPTRAIFWLMIIYTWAIGTPFRPSLGFLHSFFQTFQNT